MIELVLKSTRSSPQSRFQKKKPTRTMILKDRAQIEPICFGSKACKKESTSRKPREIKLPTQQRTISNYEVVTKLYLIEQQKNQLVEEEEIHLLRKEMVPRAQLMPFFDRPFFLQRSNSPLTIPREPTFGLITRKCSTSKHCSWG
ncbi:hypothetical protein UlMin_020283 [Ulmus minor]